MTYGYSVALPMTTAITKNAKLTARLEKELYELDAAGITKLNTQITTAFNNYEKLLKQVKAQIDSGKIRNAKEIEDNLTEWKKYYLKSVEKT